MQNDLIRLKAPCSQDLQYDDSSALITNIQSGHRIKIKGSLKTVETRYKGNSKCSECKNRKVKINTAKGIINRSFDTESLYLSVEKRILYSGRKKP